MAAHMRSRCALIGLANARAKTIRPCSQPSSSNLIASAWIYFGLGRNRYPGSRARFRTSLSWSCQSRTKDDAFICLLFSFLGHGRHGSSAMPERMFRLKQSPPNWGDGRAVLIRRGTRTGQTANMYCIPSRRAFRKPMFQQICLCEKRQ